MIRGIRAARGRLGLMAPALMILSPAPVEAQRATRTDMIRTIDSLADAALQDGRAAGMSIAVVRDGDTLVMKGFGFTDLEWKVPTPDRGVVYEIGSITKQFTAAAVFTLVEQGKLSLDDELATWLPDYPTQGHRVTIRRLMDHTSGIKGYTEMPAFRGLAVQKLPRDTLVTLVSAQPFDFPPGEAMVYNNSAYFLLGLIIEKASGQTYDAFVRDHLFLPAGMSDSRYCSENAVVERRAHGYDMSPAGLVRAAYLDHRWPYAAGSLCSTTGDLVAWNQALHGGRLLSAESYRQLISPDTLNDGSRLRYAKGVARATLLGHEAIQHGGGINGFLSDAAYFPESRTIIVVLVNTAGPVAPGEITRGIADAVLGARPDPPAVAFTGDPAQFSGTYRGVGRGSPLIVTVSAAGDSLMVQVGTGQPAPLLFRGGETFAAGSRVFTFVREASAVTGLKADLGGVFSRLIRQ